MKKLKTKSENLNHVDDNNLKPNNSANSLIQFIKFLPDSKKISYLDLDRDLTKHIKRGHRWIYDSIKSKKQIKHPEFGLLTYKNEILGVGFYNPNSTLKFRMFCLADDFGFNKNNIQKTLTDWADSQWVKAIQLRRFFDLNITNCFRLINGEGDGLPGLVVDLYNDTAVIKFENEDMENLWNSEEIANRIVQVWPQIKNVYLKRKNDAPIKGQNIIGKISNEVIFKENNCFFSSNIIDAAKTGFFLDQRDNRRFVQNYSKNLDVLNLFSYTGGFSIFAGKGQAKSVTSVDIAKAAIENVARNFELNQLTCQQNNIATDAFAFVEQEIKQKSKYGLVITDPPSFAPNEKSVPQATAAYTKIFSDSIKLVKKNGYFAASSCSSHIDSKQFMEICKEAFSKTRKRGTLVYWGGQPSDHPFPLAMEELRYLKFAFFRIDD